MSSRRVENYRRTTQRLLAQEREYQQCKVFLLDQSPTRRAELAAYLLTRLGVEFDGSDIGAQATLLAYQTLELQNAILQRAVMAPQASQPEPCGMATPPATNAPSAKAPGFISGQPTPGPSKEGNGFKGASLRPLTPPGGVITGHAAGADALPLIPGT